MNITIEIHILGNTSDLIMARVPFLYFFNDSNKNIFLMIFFFGKFPINYFHLATTKKNYSHTANYSFVVTVLTIRVSS